MGNKICACDEASSDATTTQMSIARPLAIKVMERDDSRAKLMVRFPTREPDSDSDESSPSRSYRSKNYNKDVSSDILPYNP